MRQCRNSPWRMETAGRHANVWTRGISVTKRMSTGLPARRAAKLESTWTILRNIDHTGLVNSSVKRRGMKTARTQACVWSGGVGVSERTSFGLAARRAAHLESTWTIIRTIEHHGPANSLVAHRMKTAHRHVYVWSRDIAVTKRTITGLAARRAACQDSSRMIIRIIEHPGLVNS